MSIETDITSFVSNVTAIKAAAPNKVFPVFAPESSVAPYLVYRRIGTERRYSLSTSVNPVCPTFRVTCWAATYAQACELATALRAAVNVARTEITITGVQSMKVVDEADEFEPSPELVSKQLYGRYLDIEIRHDE